MIFLPFGLFTLRTFVNGVIVDDISDLLVYSNDASWETASASQPALYIKWAGNSRGNAYGGTWHEWVADSTLYFNFTGTSISCYGIVANVGDNTSILFNIDGVTAPTFNRGVTDLSRHASTAEDYDYGVQLLTATGLSPTSHTLSLGGQYFSAPFGFDYLEYTPVDAASTTGQTASNTQTTGVTPSTAANSTSRYTPTNSLPPISISTASAGTTADLPSSTSQQGGQPNTAALVVGVTGGVATLVLLIFGVYWCLRGNRRTDPSGANPTVAESVQPFSAPDQTYTIPLTEKQHYNTFWSPQGQQDPLTDSTAPPSFHTRPLMAQYGHGVDGHSSGSRRTSDIIPNDTIESSVRLPEEANGSYTSGTEQMTSAPPYFEDVLARTDARNLSENDVDRIARRLAEVMRINSTTRGGPGLLQGAPHGS